MNFGSGVGSRFANPPGEVAPAADLISAFWPNSGTTSIARECIQMYRDDFSRFWGGDPVGCERSLAGSDLYASHKSAASAVSPLTQSLTSARQGDRGIIEDHLDTWDFRESAGGHLTVGVFSCESEASKESLTTPPPPGYLLDNMQVMPKQ